MVNVKEIENFKEYGRCVSISNGIVEALVTVDLGPRIISFGYIGSQNFMSSDRYDYAPMTDDTFTEFWGENRAWENFGGHRIWLSPESYPETYLPDDRKVDYEITENGAKFIPLPDTQVGAQKTLEIEMSPDSAEINVKMNVKNISSADKEFAVWALSVCAKGGTLIIPMNTNDTGLLPNRKISVWPYTDMSSDRLYWGKKYITIKQDVNATEPIKIGLDLNCGTAYYVLGDEILYKNYKTNHPDGVYPDGGCSFETYTNDVMLEFETLSELKNVAPGESIEHCEKWTLCKKPCDVDFKNDASVENLISKI
ncbi:MAG: hypothetical protein IKB45_03670 [Clostridia bacterium]|nr:hypothetical protein [Clostridia bacterium]